MAKELFRVLTPNFIWKALQAGKRYYDAFPVRMMNRWGVNFQRKNDVYSPLPDWNALVENQKRWNKPSSFQGIDYNLENMKRLTEELLSFQNTTKPFPHVRDLLDYGEGYQQVDALMLYGMLLKHKPKRYVEIGGGMSTYFANFARQQYKQPYTQITTFEPFPYAGLTAIEDVTLIPKLGQDIPLQFFDQLEAGDIMFVDSSHVVKIDGEVNYFVLEVLPRLKPGVLIHFHDIPFPYNIPHPADFWITSRNVQSLQQTREPMYWTEPAFLQAFLMYNDAFKIELSLPLLRYFDEPFLKQVVPDYKTLEQSPNSFSSLWIRRVK